MGGQPRTTSGDAGLQDGSTPPEFMVAVERRFGPVTFDLAAHRLNKKHARYFAPKTFPVKYDPDKPFPGGGRAALVARLVAQGAVEDEADDLIHLAIDGAKKCVVHVPNRDPGALGFDALSQPWAPLSRQTSVILAQPSASWAHPGLLWLNCEWADVAPWAAKCLAEAEAGANVLLLTHLAVADWARDLIFGRANVLLLSGRMSFDGKNVLPKDTALAHFWPGQTGRICIWDWRKDRVTTSWRLE